MVVIETDLVLALASKTDKRHLEAVNIVRNVKHLMLSPYTLVELEILIKSGKIKVILPDFYKALDQVIQFYSIGIIQVKPIHMVIAQKLRETYGLTHFDSLHASVAIAENDVLLSYNNVYSKIVELKYLHPTKLLKSNSYH